MLLFSGSALNRNEITVVSRYKARDRDPEKKYQDSETLLPSKVEDILKNLKGPTPVFP